jgi:hypothetical protein
LANGQACLVAETTGPLNTAAAAEPKQRRYGLIGMRERATALGGEFNAGPTPKYWRVTAGFLRAEAKLALRRWTLHIRVAVVDDQAWSEQGSRESSPSDGFEVAPNAPMASRPSSSYPRSPRCDPDDIRCRGSTVSPRWQLRELPDAALFWC